MAEDSEPLFSPRVLMEQHLKERYNISHNRKAASGVYMRYKKFPNPYSLFGKSSFFYHDILEAMCAQYGTNNPEPFKLREVVSVESTDYNGRTLDKVYALRFGGTMFLIMEIWTVDSAATYIFRIRSSSFMLAQKILLEHFASDVKNKRSNMEDFISENPIFKDFTKVPHYEPDKWERLIKGFCKIPDNFLLLMRRERQHKSK